MLSLALAVLLAQAEVPAELTLAVGETVTLHVPRLQRVAVSGNASMLDMRPLGHDELQLTAYAEGKTTVPCWSSDGKRWMVRVTITPPRTGAQPVPAKRRVERAKVNGQDRTVTVFEFPETLETITEAREVDGGVLLRGLTAKGVPLEVVLTPR